MNQELDPPIPQADIAVCAFYKFVSLPDFQALRDPLLRELNRHSIRGTVLLAAEGINGTISGLHTDIKKVLAWLAQDDRFAVIDHKISWHKKPPFHRTKVKLKREIVTMGIDNIDPNNIVGTYVEAQEWNALISDPETLLIDARNDYEVGIGTFTNAINPHTETFREFPQYVAQHLDPQKHKKVAMFCTGGIRCEKASAYMKKQGFEEVFHLRGGILKYFEDVDASDSLWQGECFVFDDRVAVNHALEKGTFDQCHACRYPITKEQKQSTKYVAGVSCPRCYNTSTDEQKARFTERERQIKLAKSRGEEHLGSDSQLAATSNRELKRQRKPVK